VPPLPPVAPVAAEPPVPPPPPVPSVMPVDKTTGRPTDRIVEKQVKKLLGGSDYEKWYVVGRIHTRDPVGDVAREFERNGVKLVFFEDLLADLKKSLTGIHMDNARRYIELCDAFLGRGPRASIQSPGS